VRSEEEGCRVTAIVFMWNGRSKERYPSTSYTLLSLLILALSTDGADKYPGMQACDLLPSSLLFFMLETAITVCSLLPSSRALLSALLHPNGYNEMERETCTENSGGGNSILLAPIEIHGGSGQARDY
jgi:hypothetical protein